MQLIATLFLTMIFSLINGAVPSQIEQSTFQTRNELHSTAQNTFEFIVYCTIKKTTAPGNVPRSIRVIIANNETISELKRNRWFVLFPRVSRTKNVWIIGNRSEAFDLKDDLELRIFEQFCFLKPKLPIGFPSIGLLNRCPIPSAEYCLSNGTQIRRDELLELKTFLTSSTTRKSKVLKSKRSPRSNPLSKSKQFIKPVW